MVGAMLFTQPVFGLFWPPMHQRAVLAAGGGTLTNTLHVVWTIVTGPEVGAQRRNRRADHAVAEAYAALARREAGRLNRDGDYRAVPFLTPQPVTNASVCYPLAA